MDSMFDVFVSYSHKNRGWVDNFLVPRLEQAGLKVCIDHRDFAVGLPAVENMSRAVEKSRRVVIVLTPEWIKSEWAAFESLLSQTLDPAGSNLKTIPLMLEDCALPLRLSFLTSADLRQASTWESDIQRVIRNLLSV